jgi:hypothetical protein
MSDFDTISSVQQAVQNILDQVNQGNVVGIIYQIKLDTDQSMTGWTNNISYIERLGLLEMAKQDMQYVVGSDIED